MLVLTVTRGPDQGKQLPMQPGKRYTVGSADESLALTDPRVLSPHCSLQTDSSGRVLLVNETASAGTFVGDRKIAKALIKPGVTFRVGDTLIALQAVPERAARPPTAPAGPEPAHGAKRRRVIDQKNDPLLGTIVGGYKLNEVVGRGGMGTVYKATQLSLHRDVALKVLRPALARDENFRQLFINEARAAAQLVDPNIVQVYDAGTEGEVSFFSMEFIGKGSVEEILEDQGKVPWEEAILMVLEAAHGLVYAENKGIVHRDIKPDNLMINDDGRIKIADLGLAKKGESSKDDGIIGTPHFIPPEQALGKDVDIRADIYSLGCTFFRMITGRTVFSGQTAREIVLKHVKEPAPAASSIEKGVPGDLDLVLAKMMAKEPDRRYQSAKELISALEEVCAHHGIKGSIIKKGVGKKVLIPLALVVVVGAWFAYDLIEKSNEARRIQEEESLRSAEQARLAAEKAARESEQRERADRLRAISTRWNELEVSYYRHGAANPIDETYDDDDGAVREQREKAWLDIATSLEEFADDERLTEFEEEHRFSEKASELATQIRERLRKRKESAADKRDWNRTHLRKVEEIDKRLRDEVDSLLAESRYERAWRLAAKYGAAPTERTKDDPFREIEVAEWVSPNDASDRIPVTGFSRILNAIEASRKHFAALAPTIPDRAGAEWAKVKEEHDALDPDAADAAYEAIIEQLQSIEDRFCDGPDMDHQEQIQGYVREAAALRLKLIAQLEQRRRARVQRDRNLVRDVLRVQASLDPQVSPNNVMQLDLDRAIQAWRQLLSEGDRKVWSDHYRSYVQQRISMLEWVRYLFERFHEDLAATVANRTTGPFDDLDFDYPKDDGDTMRVRLEPPPDSPYEFAFYPKYKSVGQRAFGTLPMDWVYREIFVLDPDEGTLRWREPDSQLHFALGAFCFETMQYAPAVRHFEAAAAAADDALAEAARSLAQRARTEQAAYDDYVAIIRGMAEAQKSGELEALRLQLDAYPQKHEATRFWIEVMPRGTDDVTRDFVAAVVVPPPPQGVE